MNFIDKISYRFNKIKYDIYNIMNVRLNGLNSENYWNRRFIDNWEQKNGRVQTTLLATGYALLNIDLDVNTILDYGCACGDSLPVLKIKYPDSKLYYYDLSCNAMRKAESYYSSIACKHSEASDLKYDLVYCSNVIEHVNDPEKFCLDLCRLASKYVVIQAPYKELHDDGTLLTKDSPIEEHINTIDENLVNGPLSHIATWQIMYNEIPIAWNKGKQIYFIGKILNDN